MSAKDGVVYKKLGPCNLCFDLQPALYKNLFVTYFLQCVRSMHFKFGVKVNLLKTMSCFPKVGLCDLYFDIQCKLLVMYGLGRLSKFGIWVPLLKTVCHIAKVIHQDLYVTKKKKKKKMPGDILCSLAWVYHILSMGAYI